MIIPYRISMDAETNMQFNEKSENTNHEYFEMETEKIRNKLDNFFEVQIRSFDLVSLVL